jgi:hypothetical protein
LRFENLADPAGDVIQFPANEVLMVDISSSP